jgi:hypothetical protein
LVCDFHAVADIQELKAVLKLVHACKAPVIEVDAFAKVQVPQVLQLY